MDNWATWLLGTGTIAALVGLVHALIRFSREMLIMRVTNWSLKADEAGREHALKLLARLGAKPGRYSSLSEPTSLFAIGRRESGNKAPTDPAEEAPA